VKFNVPIVIRKKKNYWLNLNQYRNWHYQTSNNLKKAFKALVKAELIQSSTLGLKPQNRSIEIAYTLYFRDKSNVDVANVCSVVDKFTCDALVELGFLEDDCYKFVRGVKYNYGGVDKDNPRCEVEIVEL
jgi:hypothetical protein